MYLIFGLVHVVDHLTLSGKVLTADVNSEVEGDKYGACLFINLAEKLLEMFRKFHRRAPHPFHHRRGRWKPPEHA